MFKVIDGSVGEPLVTTEQLAEFEFAAVERLARMSEERRQKNLHDIAEAVYTVAKIAIEIMAHDKADAIRRVRRHPDILNDETLAMFACARDDARMLLEVIRAGECRLLIALAAVRGDGPDDDGGGETAAA
jgi:hypothetical protein